MASAYAFVSLNFQANCATRTREAHVFSLRCRCPVCDECVAKRCGENAAHDLCDLLEAASWLQSVLADLLTTLIGRWRANEHVLALYVGALTDVLAQYLEHIYERVSAEEYASRLADSLLVELTCNLIRFTVDPFSAPLHALLEPLAQNVADAPQVEPRLHTFVHSQDLTLFGQLSDARGGNSSDLGAADCRVRNARRRVARSAGALHEQRLPPIAAHADVSELFGTAAAARSSKKHAQRSLLWFVVGPPSTIVERVAAAEHSFFVLYFNECREPESLPNQQLHLSALFTRTSLQLLRADCNELCSCARSSCE